MADRFVLSQSVAGGPALTRRRVLAAAGGFCATPAGAGEAPFEAHMRLAQAQAPLTVALTLDACPGGFDARIATALVESGTPATIFVSGLWIERNRDGLAYFLAHPDIFTLENHGYRHIAPVLGRRIFGIAGAADLAAVRRETTAGAAAVRAASGKSPLWYRAATGYYSGSALAAIRDQGFAIGAFSFSGDMGASLPARAVAARIGAAQNGAVIVAHINQPHRPSGLGVIEGVAELRRRGARFVRLDALTAADMVYSQ